MIDAATVDEIIKQYKKHGWTLRRALLSSDGRKAFTGIVGDATIEDCDLNALWFSRQSKPESVTWELRRLTALPFALVAVIPAAAQPDEVESTLEQVLDEMRAKTIA